MLDFVHKLFSRHIATVIVLLAMLCGLAMSLAFQIFGDFTPCKLCFIQRYCLIGSCLWLASVLIIRHNNKIANIFYWGSVLLIFLIFIVSIYQLLVQYEIIAEPSFCIRNDNNITTKSVEDLLEHLSNTTSGGCKALGPLIFGFPISAFSCVGSFFSCLYLIISQKR